MNSSGRGAGGAGDKAKATKQGKRAASDSGSPSKDRRHKQTKSSDEDEDGTPSRWSRGCAQYGSGAASQGMLVLATPATKSKQSQDEMASAAGILAESKARRSLDSDAAWGGAEEAGGGNDDDNEEEEDTCARCTSVFNDKNPESAKKIGCGHKVCFFCWKEASERLDVDDGEVCKQLQMYCGLGFSFCLGKFPRVFRRAIEIKVVKRGQGGVAQASKVPTGSTVEDLVHEEGGLFQLNTAGAEIDFALLEDFVGGKAEQEGFSVVQPAEIAVHHPGFSQAGVSNKLVHLAEDRIQSPADVTKNLWRSIQYETCLDAVGAAADCEGTFWHKTHGYLGINARGRKARFEGETQCPEPADGSWLKCYACGAWWTEERIAQTYTEARNRIDDEHSENEGAFEDDDEDEQCAALKAGLDEKENESGNLFDDALRQANDKKLQELSFWACPMGGGQCEEDVFEHAVLYVAVDAIVKQKPAKKAKSLELTLNVRMPGRMASAADQSKALPAQRFKSESSTIALPLSSSDREHVSGVIGDLSQYAPWSKNNGSGKRAGALIGKIVMLVDQFYRAYKVPQGSFHEAETLLCRMMMAPGKSKLMQLVYTDQDVYSLCQSSSCLSVCLAARDTGLGDSAPGCGEAKAFYMEHVPLLRIRPHGFGSASLPDGEAELTAAEAHLLPFSLGKRAGHEADKSALRQGALAVHTLFELVANNELFPTEWDQNTRTHVKQKTQGRALASKTMAQTSLQEMQRLHKHVQSRLDAADGREEDGEFRKELSSEIFCWSASRDQFKNEFKILPPKTKEDIEAWMGVNKRALKCVLQYAGISGPGTDPEMDSLQSGLQELLHRKLSEKNVTRAEDLTLYESAMRLLSRRLKEVKGLHGVDEAKLAQNAARFKTCMHACVLSCGTASLALVDAKLALQPDEELGGRDALLAMENACADLATAVTSIEARTNGHVSSAPVWEDVF